MTKSQYTAIIDLKISNLHNVKLACDKVGIQNIVTSNSNIIKQASAIILPGVGSFKRSNEKNKIFET